MDALFAELDRDGSGIVDFEEFVRFVRGPMSAARRSAVQSVFKRLDVSKDGVLSPRGRGQQGPDLVSVGVERSINCHGGCSSACV